MTTAPLIPAATKRALDDWIARGCSFIIAPDGTLKVSPPVQGDDLDMIDFGRRK